MDKPKSKYLYTASLMDEALLKLLEKKDYDYITVKEICQKAGVNRSTFYLHYETIDDLLQESLSYIYSKFNEKFDSNPLNDLYLIKSEYIIPYLEFLSENRQIFLAAVEKPAIFDVMKQFNQAYNQILNPILEHFKVEECEKKYILAYYLSGMNAIIIKWIKDGCTESIDYISNLLIKYVGDWKKSESYQIN